MSDFSLDNTVSANHLYSLLPKTANPKKLLMIGLELKKLSKIINDLTPVAEVPMNNKSNSRKEKNKLASRACRLKVSAMRMPPLRSTCSF